MAAYNKEYSPMRQILLCLFIEFLLEKNVESNELTKAIRSFLMISVVFRIPPNLMSKSATFIST